MRVWTASGPRFGNPLGSQNRSQSDPEAIWKGIEFRTSILRGGTPVEELDTHPETWTPFLDYIYLAAGLGYP